MITKWLKDKYIIRYLVVAFGFSWLFWIAAWILARHVFDGDVLVNAELVEPLLNSDSINKKVLLFSILSLLGVYGPLLGAYFASRSDPVIKWQDIKESSLSFRKSDKNIIG